jgi:uncharacterized membrane protein (DUF2068 family)
MIVFLKYYGICLESMCLWLNAFTQPQPSIKTAIFFPIDVFERIVQVVTWYVLWSVGNTLDF